MKGLLRFVFLNCISLILQFCGKTEWAIEGLPTLKRMRTYLTSTQTPALPACHYSVAEGVSRHTTPGLFIPRGYVVTQSQIFPNALCCNTSCFMTQASKPDTTALLEFHPTFFCGIHLFIFCLTAKDCNG